MQCFSPASDLVDLTDISTGLHDLTLSTSFSLSIQPVSHKTQKRKENIDNKLHDTRTCSASHTLHFEIGNSLMVRKFNEEFALRI